MHWPHIRHPNTTFLLAVSNGRTTNSSARASRACLWKKPRTEAGTEIDTGGLLGAGWRDRGPGAPAEGSVRRGRLEHAAGRGGIAESRDRRDRFGLGRRRPGALLHHQLLGHADRFGRVLSVPVGADLLRQSKARRRAPPHDAVLVANPLLLQPLDHLPRVA